MTRNGLCLLFGLLLANVSLVQAQGVAMPVCRPVEHPLIETIPVRTAAHWRKGVEGFGEELIRNTMQLRGYEMQNIKLPGNHGIDLFAVKRNLAGKIYDARIIEAKTHYGKGMPHLGQTISGKQMSPKWLADKLRALGRAGQDGRKLAYDILRFRKERAIPVQQLGQVHDINLRSGKYTIRDPITLNELSGPMSIERLLNNVASHSEKSATRSWSLRHLAKFDKIQQSRMQSWLAGTPRSRALGQVSQTKLLVIAEGQAQRGAIRVLARTAGRVAFVVAIAMDAAEIYGHVRDYKHGSISQREFAIALARSGGGIAGAWGGAVAGFWAGGALGAWGGPLAWLTVPLGTFIGSAIGGICGYYGGSYVGDTTAKAFYGSLDTKVQNQVNQWVIKTGNPFGT